MNIKILVRTHDKTNVHDQNGRMRYCNENKKNVVIKCITSLINSLRWKTLSILYSRLIVKKSLHNYITNIMLGSQKHFVLSEADQGKIASLVANYAKSQPNLLKYSEVLTLLLDKCIFNTKFTLVDFQPLFEASLLVKSTKPGS